MQLWQIKREEKSVHITIRMQCIWRIVCVSPQLMSCVRSCTCYFSFVPSDMIYCIIQAGFVRSSQSEAGSAPDRAAAATSCSWHLHHPLTVAGIVCRHAKKRPHAGFIEKPTHSTLKRGFYGTETDFPPIETETNFLHHPVLSSSVMRHETRRWIFPCWSPLHVSSTFVLGPHKKAPIKGSFVCVWHLLVAHHPVHIFPLVFWLNQTETRGRRSKLGMEMDTKAHSSHQETNVHGQGRILVHARLVFLQSDRLPIVCHGSSLPPSLLLLLTTEQSLRFSVKNPSGKT